MEQLVDRPLAVSRELKDEVDLLRQQVARLESDVGRLASRLDDLQTARRTAPTGGEVPPANVAAELLPADAAAGPMPVTLARATAIPAELTHVGRLMLALAGGFLLRAATDGGQLPLALGVALGLAYALAWLPAAQRAYRRGDRGAAAFHGVAAVALAYPLVFEAVQRFHVLGPLGGALVLAGLAALQLRAAWQQRSRPVASLVIAATLLAAGALAVVTRAPAPFALVLVGLAGATLALQRQPKWRPLAWASAAAAALATAVVTLGALLPHSSQQPGAALGVQLSLLMLYLGYAAALAVRGQRPGWPLLAQVGVAVLLGWGGAIATAADRRALALGVGCLGIVLAVAAEAFALRRADAAPSLRLLFFFAAAAFALGGSALLLPSPALLWAALAVAAAAAGARRGEPAVELQGGLLVAAAALGSGALAAAGSALLLAGTGGAFWPPEAILAALAVVLCLAPLATARHRDGPLHHAAAGLLLALACWLSAGAVAALATSLFPADDGLRAALGTVLLAAAATLLARLGCGARFSTAAWLVYPLLVAVALKVVLVDLPHGRPFTLFLSLAALGSALLLAARGGRATVATR